MIRGHFELHANSNGWKYRSASITSPLPGTSGKVPDLIIRINHTIRIVSLCIEFYLFDLVACLLLIFSVKITFTKQSPTDQVSYLAPLRMPFLVECVDSSSFLYRAVFSLTHVLKTRSLSY